MRNKCKIHPDVKTEFSERWDSYYCPICNEWIEKKCPDPDCDFCKDRPERPVQC